MTVLFSNERKPTVQYGHEFLARIVMTTRFMDGLDRDKFSDSADVNISELPNLKSCRSEGAILPSV